MAAKVLVLNQDFQAISICSPERAFVLVLLQKAELVSPRQAKSLRSVGTEFLFPSIIRLFRFVQLPYKKVSLSRQNIFKRDNFRCVYCGRPDSLTLDHVIPRSRGGRESWHNLVTACQRCNTLKGDRTPQEAEMKMAHEPFRPSFIMYLRDFNGKVQDEWRPYLLMN
jgi:5-methylcytosine-specific restriction endonuclease McrA